MCFFFCHFGTLKLNYASVSFKRGIEYLHIILNNDCDEYIDKLFKSWQAKTNSEDIPMRIKEFQNEFNELKNILN